MGCGPEGHIICVCVCVCASRRPVSADKRLTGKHFPYKSKKKEVDVLYVALKNLQVEKGFTDTRSTIISTTCHEINFHAINSQNKR